MNARRSILLPWKVQGPHGNPLPLEVPESGLFAVRSGSGHGMTAFLRNLTCHLLNTTSSEGGKVLYFQPEGSRWEACTGLMKMEAAALGVNFSFNVRQFTFGKDFGTGDWRNYTEEEAGLCQKALRKVQEWVTSGRLEVDEETRTIEALCKKARVKGRDPSLKAIIVDGIRYYQIGREGGRPFVAGSRFSYLAGMLFYLAEDLRCPVVASSHLHDAAASHPCKMGTGVELFTEGGLAKYADSEILLWNTFKPYARCRDLEEKEKRVEEMLQEAGRPHFAMLARLSRHPWRQAGETWGVWQISRDSGRILQPLPIQQDQSKTEKV